jgi:hypothetical protein
MHTDKQRASCYPRKRGATLANSNMPVDARTQGPVSGQRHAHEPVPPGQVASFGAAGGRSGSHMQGTMSRVLRPACARRLRERVAEGDTWLARPVAERRSSGRRGSCPALPAQASHAKEAGRLLCCDWGSASLTSGPLRPTAVASASALCRRVRAGERSCVSAIRAKAVGLGYRENFRWNSEAGFCRESRHPRRLRGIPGPGFSPSAGERWTVEGGVAPALTLGIRRCLMGRRGCSCSR